jgi:hypothetical protein
MFSICRVFWDLQFKSAKTDAFWCRQVFSTFLWEQASRGGKTVNQTATAADLTGVHATFLSSCALSHTSRRRIAVVGNGNIYVGSNAAARITGQPIVERLADSGFPDLRIDSQDPLQNSLKRNRAGKCGAMSEQSADSGRGNESVPQKLVHLVGYRDPKAGPDPWVRPRPIPVKR